MYFRTQYDPLDSPQVKAVKQDALRSEIADIGLQHRVWEEPYAMRLRYGMGVDDPEDDESDVEAAYKLLPQVLEEAFYRALAAYYDYEGWDKKLPHEGGLNEQPYMWRIAVECVRAAFNRHRREEDIKQRKIQQQSAASEAAE